MTSLKFNSSPYGGWPSLGLTPDAEATLLAQNEMRMRALYPGGLHDDLLTLQRRGWVVYYRKYPSILRVGSRDMSVSEFRALAARERARVQQHQPIALAAE